MQLLIDVKRCTKCEEAKPLLDFYEGSLAKGGKGKNSSWCKLCVTAYNRKNYLAHAEARKAYRRKYVREHQEQIKLWRKIHYLNNKDSIDRKNHEWQHQTTILLREQVLRRFGSKCEHCGFADPRALQIDHIHSDGAKERREISGIPYLNRLVNLPELELRRNYQLLCANCQWIKRFEKQENHGKHGKWLSPRSW